MKRFLCFTLSIFIFSTTALFSHRSHAGIIQNLANAGMVAEVYGAKSIKFGVNKDGSQILYFLNKEKEVLHTVRIPKASAEELASASPSNLEHELANFKKQSLGSIAVNAAIHLKQFPWESANFFVALGAIAAYNLVYHYAEDPAAFDTFLNGQKSVTGQVGFAAFMYTNSFASQAAMNSALRNKRIFQQAMPYFGMSIGLIAQKIVSEIMQFPGYNDMLKCLKSDQPACDRAYRAWNETHFQRKAGQIVPGLISMTASTALMTAGWYAGEKTIEFASKQALKVLAISGFKFAFAISDAGILVKSIEVASWGLQVANILGFLELNEFIEIPLMQWWNNNVSIGPDLEKVRQNILIESSQPGKMTTDLIRKMDLLASLTEEWQQNNARKTYTTYNNWLSYLSNFSSSHDYSKNFYSDFVNDIWNNSHNPGLRRDLFRLYPLWGVKRPDGRSPEASDYLNLADVIEKEQLDTIKATSQNLEIWLKENQNRIDLTDQFFLQEIISNFNSEDLNKIAKGIMKIGSFLITNSMRKVAPRDDSFLNYIKTTYEKLGSPTPIMDRGIGYLKAKNLTYAAALQTREGLAFNESNKHLLKDSSEHYPNDVSFLIHKMIWGAEAEFDPNYMTTFSSKGFQPKFVFPKIFRTDTNPNPNIVSDHFNTHDRTDIYNELLYLYQYGIRDSVISINNSKGSNIDSWWETNITPKYIFAWSEYGKQYEKILEEYLIDLTKDIDQNKENNDPYRYKFSKGIIVSSKQEMQVYATVLKTYMSTGEEIRSLLKTHFRNIEQAISIIKRNYENKNILSTHGISISNYIANKQLESYSEEFNSALKELVQKTLSKTTNKNSRLVIESTQKHMENAFNKIITNLKIVNAVNYIEKYEDGLYKSEKCIKMNSNLKTTKDYRAALQECSK